MRALLDLVPRFDWQSAPLPLAALWDESAHLITTAIILLALAPRVAREFAGGALVASVLIDVDHLPLMLGWLALRDGTPRPISHSLVIVIALLVLAALVRPPYRTMLLGAAFGVGCHLLRDMATGGVVLYWPVAPDVVTIAWGHYIIALGVLAAVALARRFPPRRITQRSPVS